MTEIPEDGNGDWDQWRRLVLSKLETLEAGQTEFREQIGSMKTDMALQKAKSGLLGAAAGTVAAVTMYVIDHWTGPKH